MGSSYRIAVLAGDGIGPEVMAEAVRVLAAAARRFGFDYTLEEALVGGAAYDATGSPLPPETLALCREADAVLFGAVGGEQWDGLPRHLRPETGALLPLRKELGLYANLRPVRTFRPLLHTSPLRAEVLGDGVDIMFIRELTGGLYFGQPKGRQTFEGVERTVDTMAYTDAEMELAIRLGFETARGRRGHLTSVDKANVLETSRRWREIATAMAKEYPDVRLDHMYVDNCAMQLIRNPRSFDTVVTENTFGDILTDEGATLAGSIGMLASASLGRGKAALYEPIHGTAPDIAGQGLANPLAQILSMAMMLRYSLGQPAAADAVEAAVGAVLEAGLRTGDLRQEGCRTLGTAAMGDAVVEQLLSSH